MKVLIFSDSHGDIRGICDAIDDNKDANLIIHAGDVQRDVDDILSLYPKIPFVYVLGNNDFFVPNVRNDALFELGGKRFFVTHGHKYGVKSSEKSVVTAARRQGADICIFGHTHSKYLDMGDICVVNPGSARRSYAILTIEDGNINVIFKET